MPVLGSTIWPVWIGWLAEGADVAGTDDHVYGQSGAAEMARTAPARAVNNADSHEYFGENAPPLN